MNTPRPRRHPAVLTAVGLASLLLAGVLGGPPAVGQVNPVDEFIEALNTPAGREFASQFLGGEPDATTHQDPPGDFQHSTGEPPGYTPDRIDILTGRNYFFSLPEGELPPPDDGGTWGLFGCDTPPGPDAMLFTLCPDPPATIGGSPPPSVNHFFAAEFELAGPPTPAVPGRCEIVFWAHDPSLGPAFAAGSSFPNDPADGTNVAWGMGFNPANGAAGQAGIFKLQHPGSGGFESMPTDALGIVNGTNALLLIPEEEAASIDLGTFYTFCVEEGFSFAPEDSGADQVPKVALDLTIMPRYLLAEVEPEPTAAPSPSPVPTEPETSQPTERRTTGAATSGEESGGGAPIGPIAIATGLGLVAAGTVLRRRGGTVAPPMAIALAEDDPCARLARAYAEAQADAEAKRGQADEAGAEADTAEQAARDARDAEQKADEELEDAEKERKQAERDRDRPPPGEEEAFIEDAETGERITGRDLRLRREAAREAWDDYRSDPSSDSAKQTEQDWQDLDAEGARDARRQADDADQAQRQADLDAAEAAKSKAEAAERDAEQAREDAERSARDKRDAADRADEAADAAEARAAELKRKLDECLGLKGGRGGQTTPWGPVGIAHDEQAGCYPEGNVEEVVLDTFDRTVRLDVWVTAPEDSGGHHEAQRLAGEMRYWRDIFGLTSAAINVKGAVEGLGSRTVRDGVDTALSGGSVIAGEHTGLDIPTVLPQVPVVVLEGLAATAGTIFDAWGRWIEQNHVGRTLQLGDVHRHVHLEWVEVRRCEGGRVRCVERYVRIQLGPEEMSGALHSEDIVPREPWRRRAQGLARTLARRIKTDAEAVRDFMGKYDGQPCE